MTVVASSRSATTRMILEFLPDWGAYSALVRGHNPDVIADGRVPAGGP
jgi:hypothetical protein